MQQEIKRYYPEAYEFISFFETEPEVLDIEAPWYYNTLVYKTVQDDFNIECRLSPAEGEMALKVTMNNKIIISLSLNFIEEIKFETHEDKETMIIDFTDNSNLYPLVLQIRPVFNLIWDTNIL